MPVNEEEKRVFGALSPRRDVRDYKLQKVKASTLDLPETFELEHTAIKDQDGVGSCVAHSVSEVVEYFQREQQGVYLTMSASFIYGNRRDTFYKKEGMYVRDALHNACKYGTPYYGYFYHEDEEVPEIINSFNNRYEDVKEYALPNRLSTYFRLTSDVDIKRALMNYGPVVFAMTWREDITVDKEGVMQVNTKSKKAGGHCMVIYGWNEKGWLIQNSWGTSWGKEGCAILPYNVKKNEAWGVTDEIIDGKGEIKKCFNTTFTRWLAKILNWLLNLFKRGK